MSARRACVEILAEILDKKQFLNTFKSRFESADTAFCNYLLLCVLRHIEPLDAVIKQFVSKPFNGKRRILRSILLCASAELLDATTPDYAVLNEYVSIAKRLSDRFAAGMVNAVLRKIAVQKAEFYQQFLMPKFPKTFRQILTRDYSPEQISSFESILNTQPPLDLSVVKDAPLWAERLDGTLFENGTIRLEGQNKKVESLEGFQNGAWWVQDLAASLPVELLGSVTGLNVLDVCAAPGGKTAQLLARGANVTALDIDSERLKRLQENIRRLNLTERLNVLQADGLTFLRQTKQVFDAIVLDAPCSATGTYRRHPEVISLKTNDDITKQCHLQQDFLDRIENCLKKGGKLLYCTCSITKDENERQIENFLKKHPNFEVINQDQSTLHKYDGKILEKGLLDKGVLRTLPYNERENGGMDAFFAVCLKKIE